MEGVDFIGLFGIVDMSQKHIQRMGYQGEIENEPHPVTTPALQVWPLVILPPCLIKINLLILVLQLL